MENQNCKQTTKAGNRCKNLAKKDGYCTRHYNLANGTTKTTAAPATQAAQPATQAAPAAEVVQETRISATGKVLCSGWNKKQNCPCDKEAKTNGLCGIHNRGNNTTAAAPSADAVGTCSCTTKTTNAICGRPAYGTNSAGQIACGYHKGPKKPTGTTTTSSSKPKTSKLGVDMIDLLIRTGDYFRGVCENPEIEHEGNKYPVNGTDTYEAMFRFDELVKIAAKGNVPDEALANMAFALNNNNFIDEFGTNSTIELVEEEFQEDFTKIQWVLVMMRERASKPEPNADILDLWSYLEPIYSDRMPAVVVQEAKPAPTPQTSSNKPASQNTQSLLDKIKGRKQQQQAPKVEEPQPEPQEEEPQPEPEEEPEPQEDDDDDIELPDVLQKTIN